MSLPAAAAIVIFSLMVLEAAIAARNDRALRALGAIEPEGDVYRVMQVAYPAAFLVMLGEGAWRGTALGPTTAAGVGVLAAAKALKYWAVASLGSRWTFRVLVPPGSRRTGSGPYRWLDHPNYVAVALELAGTGLAMRAWVCGPAAVLGFGYLMWRRVQVEEQALGGQ